MNQLQAELNQFPNISVRKKRRIFGYLTELGAEAIQDIDYDMRQAYIGKLRALKGYNLRKEYLEILDTVKLSKIREAEKNKKCQTIKYAEQTLFLLYYPKYKIAKSFDAEEDQEIVLWEFGLKGKSRFKRQVFNLLMHILDSDFESNVRREKYLIPLKLMYEYGLLHGTKDLRSLSKTEEEKFLWFIINDHPLQYDATKRFVEYCRKFLFVYRGRVHWDSYVWYIERLHLKSNRGIGEVTKTKLSFLDLHDEHREILQSYMKYLIQITDVSISSFRSTFFTVRTFLLFLESEGNLLTNSHNRDIKEFFFEENEKDNTPSTFNQKVREIRIFLQYLNAHKKVDDLFVLDEYYFKRAGIHSKKTDVTQEEINIFIEAFKCFPEKIWLMCLILLFTGIQKGSLFSLKACDLITVDDVGYLNIYSTRKRASRELPLSDEMYGLLTRYISDKGIKENEFIFRSKAGNPYNATSFRKRILQLCEGLKKLHGKYVFKDIEYRKWTARYLHQNGLSIQGIREYLGLGNDELVKKYIQSKQTLVDQHSDIYFSENNNLAAEIETFGRGIK